MHSGLPDHIDLCGHTAIASGHNRIIYVVPGRHEYIVKVFRDTHPPALQRQQAAKRKLPWIRPEIVFDQNKYDLREITRLEARHGEKIWQHFPKTESIVDTSAGPGLLQARIFNVDGSIAETLDSYLNQRKPIAPALVALDQLKQFLSRHHIVVRDIYPRNLMARQIEEMRIELVIVDGFGNSDFIKIASYSRYFNDAKLERKFNRIMRNTSLVRQKPVEPVFNPQ